MDEMSGGMLWNEKRRVECGEMTSQLEGGSSMAFLWWPCHVRRIGALS